MYALANEADLHLDITQPVCPSAAEACCHFVLLFSLHAWDSILETRSLRSTNLRKQGAPAVLGF
eukprot:scaffold185598_cov20-Tisochrysis_lutea.AAC.3